MRKNRKRLLLLTGIVLAVLVLTYALALRRSTVRRRRAYALLEANGRPMQAADIIPAEVPESDNAAVLFGRATYPLKAETLGRYTLLERLGRLASRFNRDSLDAEDFNDFKAYMAQESVSNARRLFEQGAERPVCRFNRVYDDGVLTDATEAYDLRHLVQIWLAQSKLDSEAKRLGRQDERIFMLLNLANLLRADPNLASQRIRNSLMRSACLLIQNRCYPQAPEAQEIHRLQDRLQGLDSITPLVRAVDAERLLRGERLFNLPLKPLAETLRQDTFIGGGTGPLFGVYFAIVKFKPRFVADHAGYLELMQQAVDLLEAPYSLSARQQYRESARSGLITGELAPIVDFDKRGHCSTVATVRMTRAGLALMQYRRERGAFPERLDVLAGVDVNDPFSGNSLVYRSDGTAFSIYSVGENQQDNEGKPREREHKENDDIAWHLPSLSERDKTTRNER